MVPSHNLPWWFQKASLNCLSYGFLWANQNYTSYKMLEKYDIMPQGKIRSKPVPKHKLSSNLTLKTNHNKGNKRYDWSSIRNNQSQDLWDQLRLVYNVNSEIVDVYKHAWHENVFKEKGVSDKHLFSFLKPL